jgi:hypothetical protein
MVSKTFRQGFYWLTAADDMIQIMRSCKGCQYFARQVHTPTYGPLPCGARTLGVLKKAPGGFTHLLVAVDKFIKWIKAKSMAKIGSKQAVSFVQDIFFRFGAPNAIITDNDTQFTSEKFLNFYDDNNI